MRLLNDCSGLLHCIIMLFEDEISFGVTLLKHSSIRGTKIVIFSLYI